MSDKINVLMVSDNVVSTTGVGNQSAEIAKALFNKGYGVYQIGVGAMQPNLKFLYTFPTGEQVTIFTEQVYDNIEAITSIIVEHNIKALILVTDPSRFIQVWNNSRVIRNRVPIIYWNLWDTNLLPDKDSERPHYNKWIYESCDALPCISQQSENFVKQILSDLPELKRPKVTYIPHGSNEYIFKPLSKEAIAQHKKAFFGGKDFDYVVLFNSRNQGRKKAPDLIFAWNQFFKELPKDKQDKVALVLHTEPVAPMGTDLNEVIMALAPNANVFLDPAKRSQEEMNILYNVADVTFSVSNAEGFGLSAQESLLAGTPIAATVTGGLQDSIGFFDEDGKRIQFNREFTSNNIGRYKTHGEWSFPLFPSVQRVIGSPPTPYLFDDEVSHETIKKGLIYYYKMSPDERKRRGLKGREWCFSQKMTATALSESFTKEVEETLKNFKPKNLFELYKV